MRKKRIALVFGMEDTFPWALIDAINTRGGDQVEAMPAEISYLKDDGVFPYDLILDRISHEIPFYRTYLKCAAASGVKIVNNPIWWSADDKFFDNLVAKSVNVAVPKTVLLPHKDYPPSTEAKSFRNMKWVKWDEVFAYLGFPIFMKPAKEVATANLTNLGQKSGKLFFTLKNEGTVHFVPQEIRVRGYAGFTAAVDNRMDGWYILAGGQRDFDMAFPEAECSRITSVTVDVQLGSESLQERLQTPNGVCSR